MDLRNYLIQDDWEEFDNTIGKLIESFENDGVLNEGLLDTLSSKMKNGVEFIKKFSELIGAKLLDVLKLFKNKILFTFFNKLKWNIKSFISIIKDGYKLWRKLHDVIAEYIASNDVVKWTHKQLTNLDSFLAKHPILKRVGTLVVVGFLIYQWTQMISFTGDIEFDFDQSVLFSAMAGNFSLADLFATADGIKMLLFIATNALTGITFPWPGDAWLLFAISIVYTVAKKKHPDIARSIIKNVKKYKGVTA